MRVKVGGCRQLRGHLLIPHLVPLGRVLPKELASRQQEAF